MTTSSRRSWSRMASRAVALGGLGLLGITTNAAAQASWTVALPPPDPANTQAEGGTQARVVRGQAAMPAPVPDMFFNSFAPFEMGPMMEMQGLSLQGEKVTGAPYSAEAVTEMTQTLADGNRIVRTVTASVARDSEGRTRREQVLAAFGPWMPAKQPKSVVINDPVAGVSYMLEEEQKIAVKMPAAMSLKIEGGHQMAFVPAGKAEHDAEKTVHYKIERKEDGPPPPPLPPPPAHITGAAGVAVGAGADGIGSVSFMTSAIDAYHGGPGQPAPEQKSLGTSTIEGVEATGTQSTVTIPAGAIGNEQPIKIVSEQWYSPALQVVVMSKRSDPRTGDMVYRLTQLDRSEPAATLFQVPSDYTVKDMDTKIRRARKPPEPEQ
jgi:hypothetical protein